MRHSLLALSLAISSLATGCAGPRLVARFVPDDRLRWDKAQYPDAPLVVLHRARKRLLSYSYGGTQRTQTLVHDVLAIQKERALDSSLVRLLTSKDSEVLQLMARVVDPNGSPRPVPATNVFEQEVPGAGRVKSFRFPAVEVGSILELAYVVETPRLEVLGDFEVAAGVPVLHFEAELAATRNFTLATQVYNSAVEVERRDDDELLRRRWVVEQAPYAAAEPFSPHESFWAPSMVYRVRSLLLGSGDTVRMAETWLDIVRGLASAVFDASNLLDGVRLPPADPACGDEECHLLASVRWLHGAVVSGRSGSFGELRPLRDVLAAGSGSGFDKGVLLTLLLRERGVVAWLAGATRAHSRREDVAFPTADQLNQTLVYVPRQGKMAAARWIDPRCETCEPGDVHPQVVGQQALTFRSDSERRQVLWRPVVAAPGPLAMVKTSHRVKLEPDGGLVDALTREFRGNAATAERFGQTLQTEAKLRRAAQGELGVSTGRVVTVGRVTCPTLKVCRQEQSRSFPAHAVAEPGRWLVPLSVLSRGVEPRLGDQARTREIAFEESRHFEEELTLEIPDGFTAAELPAPVLVEAPGMAKATVEYTQGPGWVKARRSLSLTAGRHFPEASSRVGAVFAAFSEVPTQVLTLVAR